MFTGQFGHMCLRYKQTLFKLEASRLGHKTGKPMVYKWKYQDWGIKLEKPMVYKLEASRLGHKTGKPHGLQIGSIKIGA